MTTILVVDDEFLIADILGMALEDEGYMVVFASNGKRALEVLARERAGLVITDFMMPIMNGMELAQHIKSRPETASLPIILMSGAQAHIANRHPELFDAVYDKPFDIDVLIARVAELVGHPSAD
ncbi:hypothetical protein JCM19000A_33010 [Silvimonas sp. JCM 19000]